MICIGEKYFLRKAKYKGINCTIIEIFGGGADKLCKIENPNGAELIVRLSELELTEHNLQKN